MKNFLDNQRERLELLISLSKNFFDDDLRKIICNFFQIFSETKYFLQKFSLEFFSFSRKIAQSEK